jgi:DHA1 family tetracycline resistance protein-like MFS transporter
MFASPRRGIARPDAPPGAVFWILLIVFLDMTGMGLLVPVIPLIVQEFRTDALTIGWLSAAYAAAQFAATPLLGALSDRHGRRVVLLASFLGSAAAYLAFGWGPAIWILFAGRVIDGLTGANIGTSQAYIADITAPEHRSRAMALAGAALGAGFVVGPAVGIALAQFGPHVPAFVAAGLAVASTALAWWRLPESLPVHARAPRIVWRRLNPFAPLRDALGRRELRPLLAVTFLANFAMAALRSHFTYFAIITLAYSQKDVSRVMAFLGVMMVIAQGGLVRRAVRRWGDYGTLTIGLALSAAGFAGLAMTQSSATLYVMVAVTAIGVGLGLPTMAALVSHRSSALEQGAMLGAAQAAASLAQVAGPVWAGRSFDSFGPGFPFATGAVLVTVALAVVMSHRPGVARDASGHP